jgi:nucleoid-associated protein YgaU
MDSFKNVFGGKAEPEADAAGVPPAPVETAPPEADPASGPEPETGPTAEGGRTYTVQSGDTLWKIADEMYGDGSKYTKIFDANTSLLEHPDRIFPGQELHIPDLGN